MNLKRIVNIQSVVGTSPTTTAPPPPSKNNKETVVAVHHSSTGMIKSKISSHELSASPQHQQLLSRVSGGPQMLLDSEQPLNSWFRQQGRTDIVSSAPSRLQYKSSSKPSCNRNNAAINSSFNLPRLSASKESLLSSKSGGATTVAGSNNKKLTYRQIKKNAAIAACKKKLDFFSTSCKSEKWQQHQQQQQQQQFFSDSSGFFDCSQIQGGDEMPRDVRTPPPSHSFHLRCIDDVFEINQPGTHRLVEPRELKYVNAMPFFEYITYGSGKVIDCLWRIEKW